MSSYRAFPWDVLEQQLPREPWLGWGAALTCLNQLRGLYSYSNNEEVTGPMQSSCFHCLLIIDKPLMHIYMFECHLCLEYIWHRNLHHSIYVVSKHVDREEILTHYPIVLYFPWWTMFITLKFPLDARLLKYADEVQNYGSWKSVPHPKRKQIILKNIDISTNTICS